MRMTPVCCDRWLWCGWVVVEGSRIIAMFFFCSGYCNQRGEWMHQGPSKWRTLHTHSDKASHHRRS